MTKKPKPKKAADSATDLGVGPLERMAEHSSYEMRAAGAFLEEVAEIMLARHESYGNSAGFADRFRSLFESYLHEHGVDFPVADQHLFYRFMADYKRARFGLTRTRNDLVDQVGYLVLMASKGLLRGQPDAKP